MRIEIDYLVNTREAKLTTDETGKTWTSIIRVCQDKTDINLLKQDEYSIIIPWWNFLLSREGIGYHISKDKVAVTFSEAARRLLEEAKKQNQAYKEAANSPQISDAELDKKLRQAGFTRPLTPEQHANVKRLASLPSAATFSVPGAGKTTEALAYYCCQKSGQTKLIIVCPKNAFAVWEEQIAEIFQSKNKVVTRLTGGVSNIELLLQDKPDVSLITYHQVPTAEQLLAKYLLENEVFVFLDESHKMKRGDGGRIGSAILSMSHLPKIKCIMSGTPLPNSINDLVPQFRFLYPEETSVSVDNVKDLIRPVYVRTTKSQLNIPQVTRFRKDIPLSPAQRDLYQLLCSEIARENHAGISAKDRRKLRVLGRNALTLIQLVSNPTLLARRLDFEHKDLLNAVLKEGDSPKLEYITTRARQLAAQGKKTIIWSGFVRNVELIASRLRDIGADYIHGGVEAGSDEEENTRESKIKKFHDDDKAFVLVANPAACAEGISLHKVCHHAIYLDRNYNAAQYLQSEDRIHRLGLKPTDQTVIEIVCSPDTIDEAVADSLSRKVQTMKDILNDPDLNIDPSVDFDLDDEAFDEKDAESLLLHIKKEIE